MFSAKFQTLALLGIFLSANQAAYSNDGGSSTGSGGGSNYKGKFYDSYLRGTRRDIKKLDAYKDVEQILSKIENQVPEFATALREVAEKNWYFIDQRPPKLSEKETGIIFDGKDIEQAALQTGEEIYVHKRWFDKKASRDEQADLLLHELVQGARLSSRYSNMIDPASVWRLTIGLREGKFKSETQLQTALNKYSYGDYATKTELLELEKKKQEAQQAEEKAKQEKARLKKADDDTIATFMSEHIKKALELCQTDQNAKLVDLFDIYSSTIGVMDKYKVTRLDTIGVFKRYDLIRLDLPDLSEGKSEYFITNLSREFNTFHSKILPYVGAEAKPFDHSQSGYSRDYNNFAYTHNSLVHYYANSPSNDRDFNNKILCTALIKAEKNKKAKSASAGSTAENSSEQTTAEPAQ